MLSTGFPGDEDPNDSVGKDTIKCPACGIELVVEERSVRCDDCDWEITEDDLIEPSEKIPEDLY
jgi:DNA-directed RNA polymerase subunit RPC12/RpoP